MAAQPPDGEDIYRMTKWNELAIKTFIESNSNCTYINFKYLGKSQIEVELSCKCGEVIKKRLSQIQLSVNKNKCLSCKKCSQTLKSILQRKNFSEVQEAVLNDNRSNTILLTNEDEYNGTGKKLLFRCECGSSFERHFNVFQSSKKGCYCPTCSFAIRANEKRTRYDKIKAAFDERGYHLITSIYKNQTQALMYICPTHREKGEQKTLWNNFYYQGKGCKYCGYDKLKKSRQLDPHVVKEELLNKGYIVVEPFEYENYKKTITAINSDGYLVNIHYGNLQIGLKPRVFHKGNSHTIYNIRRWLKLNNETHQLISEEYVNARYNKLIWKCEDGHAYPCTWDNFKRGKRCPTCNESKGSKKIEGILKSLKVHYEKEKTFDGLKGDTNDLRFDFMIKNKILIEYDGEFHFNQCYDEFNFKRQIEYDERKNKYCIDNKISLFRIPYWELNNIETIIKTILSGISDERKSKDNSYTKYLVNHSNWSQEKYIEQQKQIS